MDILYGKNPVLEALRSGRGVRRIVVASGARDEARLREILDLAEGANILVEETSRRRLDDIAHTEHHQGVAGYFHARAPLGLDDLIAAASSPALYVVLDGIQDPQNLGALARTAEAVGAGGVIVARHRAASVTAAAVKASAGATEHVRVATVTNLAQALDRLAEAGAWRVGLAADGTTRYDRFDYTGPVALVVGAEGEGLRPLTRRHCDALVSLPMLGRITSLNAGVAGGILMYEAARQRSFALPGER
jgi:23S rRNA (guanosine2251-2'-O)-methyltransferase